MKPEQVERRTGTLVVYIDYADLGQRRALNLNLSLELFRMRSGDALKPKTCSLKEATKPTSEKSNIQCTKYYISY
jgi:hypothetical protein